MSEIIDDKSMGIERVSDTLEGERLARIDIQSKQLAFGIPFLDDMMRGILKHDLVLVGAKTGAGKTEFITKVASHNALMGKKVYVFALEAEPYEITRRIRFSELSKAYRASGGKETLVYLHWVLGDYDELLAPFEPIANKKLDSLTGLKCFYKSDAFDVKTFAKLFSWAQRDADLIICDHIHYFDFDDPNENRALAEATKEIRDLVLLHGVPTILVGHMRKLSGGAAKSAVPSADDFHGSSNLSKIVTKAITLASGGPNVSNTNEFVTFFRTAKFRMFGAAMAYIGITLFDITTNEYSSRYKLGVLSGDESKVIPLDLADYPKWLKRR